jgi:CCR4-NOT transcription complex subunit 10
VLACASREQADSANGVASNSSAGSREIGIVPTFSAVHNVSTYGDEFDTTIIKFNTVCSFVICCNCWIIKCF